MYVVTAKVKINGKAQKIELPTKYATREAAVKGGKKYLASVGCLADGDFYVADLNGKSAFSRPKFPYSKWYEVKERNIEKAENMSIPSAISLFRNELFCPYELRISPFCMRVANDRAFMKWVIDYWTFVCWNDRNHAGYVDLSEDNPYLFFIYCLGKSECKAIVDELLEYGDPKCNQLATRLIAFSKKYR